MKELKVAAALGAWGLSVPAGGGWAEPSSADMVARWCGRRVVELLHLRHRDARVQRVADWLDATQTMALVAR